MLIFDRMENNFLNDKDKFLNKSQKVCQIKEKHIYQQIYINEVKFIQMISHLSKLVMSRKKSECT